MYISISSYTYTYRYIHIHINIYIHTSSTATTTMTHPHIHRGGGSTRNQRKSAASETSRAPPQPHNHRGGGDHDPSTGGGGGWATLHHIYITNLCGSLCYPNFEHPRRGMLGNDRLPMCPAASCLPYPSQHPSLPFQSSDFQPRGIHPGTVIQRTEISSNQLISTPSLGSQSNLLCI